MSQIELPKRYRVARHIASGGMASVWEAQDLLLHRTVAVKVLGSHFDLDSGARQRFQREARTSAQISDRHIVTIYDIGEHREHAFIVMEYFAGGTVADRLRAARREGAGAIPRETALRWLREAAAGLDVAHAAGIVHRDVKPANLMLDAHDRLAVGDFGIARLADDTQMTQTGQVLGTAAYLSPEQALGEPATPASDRYALAVVAYQLLTGARPFAGGPPAAQARQHVEAPPPRASQADADLPRAVDAVLARGLAKEPSERPPSASAFVQELERALDAPAATAVEPTRPIPAVAATEPTRKAGPAAAAPDTPPRNRILPTARAATTPPAPATRMKPVSRAPAPRAKPTAPIARAPAPRAPASRAPGPNGRRRRRPPALVLLALAALAIGVIAALALAGNDRSSSGKPSAHSTTQARAGTEASTKKKPAPPVASAQPATTTTPPPPSGASPSALDARGYALIKQQSFAEAVPLERQAVAGFRSAKATGGSGYAYALFNLGTALNRSGQSAEAIPYLEERLSVSPGDRPALVQAELANARANAKGASTSATNPKRHGKKD